mmetsp:Transcript_9488/g.24085  ORF Transcript_9488/g.24085 Transcript_9488/m.24085 type:complete len:120 (+) Transcript_9488:662-1021(+)
MLYMLTMMICYMPCSMVTNTNSIYKQMALAVRCLIIIGVWRQALNSIGIRHFINIRYLLLLTMNVPRGSMRCMVRREGTSRACSMRASTDELEVKSLSMRSINQSINHSTGEVNQPINR